MHSDAFGILRREAEMRPFFLERERRAARPATMAERLAPYSRYYSTSRPIDDHGLRPFVLMIFDDELAATGFLKVAKREMCRSGVSVPLWVSNGAAIDRLGPLRPVGGPLDVSSPPRYLCWTIILAVLAADLAMA